MKRASLLVCLVSGLLVLAGAACGNSTPSGTGGTGGAGGAGGAGGGGGGGGAGGGGACITDSDCTSGFCDPTTNQCT